MTMSESGRAERRVRQRELADRLKASGALDQIFEQIDAGEVLGGDEGLLKGMLKAALERGLEVELTDHVGYERGDPEASLFPNSRNGTTAKTVSSEVGEVELAIPRDRNGTFTPQLLPKGSRRLGGLDEMIISLYAGGMTLRDIQYHLVSTIGTELSHETISKITDQVAVGVDVDGIKHVLGIWVQTSEGAKFWAGVCAELANRGIKDVLIVCCDGLTGFPEAIEATWPNSTIQTCVVHLIRAAMRFVNWKDRKAVAAALKPIYQAAAPRRHGSNWRRSRPPSWAARTPTPSPCSKTRGRGSHRFWRSRRCCAE